MLDNARPFEPELVHHRTVSPIQAHLVMENPISLAREPLDVTDGQRGIGQGGEEERKCVLASRISEGIVVDILAGGSNRQR